MNLGIERGGDTLIGTVSGQDINAGGGVKFALGVQNEVGENGKSLSLSPDFHLRKLILTMHWGLYCNTVTLLAPDSRSGLVLPKWTMK